MNGFVCDLNPKVWADKIVMAARIDAQTMQQESDNILNVASTAVIDRQYYELISEMAEGWDQN